VGRRSHKHARGTPIAQCRELQPHQASMRDARGVEAPLQGARADAQPIRQPRQREVLFVETFRQHLPDGIDERRRPHHVRLERALRRQRVEPGRAARDVRHVERSLGRGELVDLFTQLLSERNEVFVVGEDADLAGAAFAADDLGNTITDELVVGRHQVRLLTIAR